MTEPTSENLRVGTPEKTTVWGHLTNWATIYFWLPLSLLSIWLFSQFAYFLTGRRPQENLDWIVGFSFNLVKCVFVIFFVEVAREQTGVWFRKDELLANPSIAWAQTVGKCFQLFVFAYLLSH